MNTHTNKKSSQAAWMRAEVHVRKNSIPAACVQTVKYVRYGNKNSIQAACAQTEVHVTKKSSRAACVQTDVYWDKNNILTEEKDGRSYKNSILATSYLNTLANSRLAKTIQTSCQEI